MLSRHDFAFVHQVLTFARQQPEARTSWSDNMNSIAAEDIVFLLRYGQLVLDDAEYRAAFERASGGTCGGMFASFRDRLDSRSRVLRVPAVAAEPHPRRTGRDDAEVRAAMGFLKMLLLRGAIHAHTSNRAGLTDPPLGD